MAGTVFVLHGTLEYCQTSGVIPPVDISASLVNGHNRLLPQLGVAEVQEHPIWYNAEVVYTTVIMLALHSVESNRIFRCGVMSQVRQFQPRAIRYSVRSRKSPEYGFVRRVANKTRSVAKCSRQ